jgi:AcrR family transcriptional regulator
MKPSLKLSGEDRRAAIIDAVRKVFADKGFHGTVTRELAEAAGVSEALLFKHFPTKEALYSAMMLASCQEKDEGLARLMLDRQPSAKTLVLLVHTLISHMVGPRKALDDEQAINLRLMLRSLMEDGEFARLFLQRVGAQWIAKVKSCLEAAIAAGEAEETSVPADVVGWFTQHLGVMIMLNFRTSVPVVEYGVSRRKLAEHATRFALRGMGLKEDVIDRYWLQ